MAAKKKEIAAHTRESLGVSVEPTQTIEKIYVPTKTKKTEFITGTPKGSRCETCRKTSI